MIRRIAGLIIYEVHVKGFTAHPSSGVRDRGTACATIPNLLAAG
jgi:pullulanase/glycogen debranching enzyme